MSLSGNLRWRLARLAAMSPAEVAWRAGEAVRTAWEAQRAGSERFRPLAGPRGSALRGALAAGLRPLVPSRRWAERLPGEFPAHHAALQTGAQAAMAGRVTLFAREYETGIPVDWHADPGCGARVPRERAASPHHRERGRVGSVRRLWELNRHHHLAEAALWAWAGGDRAAGRFVVEQLLDWCEANPPLVGVNWTSSLELAIRTLAWAEILALLLDAEEPALDDDALAMLVGAWARQIEHVRAHDSRYSSANNHRIGEAAGLAVAGLALAFHPQAEAWREWGYGVLEEELVRQLAPDGCGREQAFAYQRFVLDFAVVACVLARGHGRDLGAAVHARLRAAAGFLDAVTRPDGQPFPVGDDDEGRAFALGESWEERTGATLECLGWLYGESPWRRSNGARARWLGLADDGQPGAAGGTTAGQALPAGRAKAAVATETYLQGGYALVTADTEAGRARLLFDAGPLGYGTLAAHGHADALSLCLWAGEDLLIDSGTGSYGGDPALRETLRGTRAHNTCEVDGRDQSEPRGPFLWGRKARSRLTASAGRDPYFLLAGRHDGYRRCGADEVRRTVVGCRDRGGVILLVADEVLGRGSHELRIPWHVGAGEARMPAGETRPMWEVRYPGGGRLWAQAVLLGAQDGPSLRAETAGADGEAAAWCSRRFEERSPAGRIAVTARAALPAAVLWLVRACPAGSQWGHPGAGAGPPPAFHSAEGGVAVRLDIGGGREFRALAARPGEVSVAHGGERLHGRLAGWLAGGDEAGAAPAAVVADAVDLATERLAWRSGTAETGIVEARARR